MLVRRHNDSLDKGMRYTRQGGGWITGKEHIQQLGGRYNNRQTTDVTVRIQRYRRETKI